jgi:hypothetical protein
VGHLDGTQTGNRTGVQPASATPQRRLLLSSPRPAPARCQVRQEVRPGLAAHQQSQRSKKTTHPRYAVSGRRLTCPKSDRENSYYLENLIFSQRPYVSIRVRLSFASSLLCIGSFSFFCLFCRRVFWHNHIFHRTSPTPTAPTLIVMPLVARSVGSL